MNGNISQGKTHWVAHDRSACQTDPGKSGMPGTNPALLSCTHNFRPDASGEREGGPRDVERQYPPELQHGFPATAMDCDHVQGIFCGCFVILGGACVCVCVHVVVGVGACACVCAHIGVCKSEFLRFPHIEEAKQPPDIGNGFRGRAAVLHPTLPLRGAGACGCVPVPLQPGFCT